MPRASTPVTLTGYMTNNCVVGSAVGAEPLASPSKSVRRDRAIPLSNGAGSASAETVHETLMTLLNSNWAAVTTTDQWVEAIEAGHVLNRGNLAESAINGRSQS